MASIEEYCVRAVDTLGPRVRHDAIEYMDRAEVYTIESDWSLALQRSLRIRWTDRKQPLCCFETGLWSPKDARFEDISFAVKTADPERTALALPCLRASVPNHAKFLVALVPPLERSHDVNVTFTWRWPLWWEHLRTKKADEVVLEGVRRTKRLAVTIQHAVDMKGLSFQSDQSAKVNTDSRGKMIRHTWTFEPPRSEKYTFECRAAP